VCAKTERIGAEHKKNTLGRIPQIERSRFAQTAGAKRTELALPAAAAGHVE
jgi:hypothetical protein